jgi:hypothetical protein
MGRPATPSQEPRSTRGADGSVPPSMAKVNYQRGAHRPIAKQECRSADQPLRRFCTAVMMDYAIPMMR